jgi:xanthine/CO dehydrogenase XdhC/CoxF family maturation factor
MATFRQPPGDPWMLPDDGIIDRIAVEIAAKGERRVRLTAPERRAAAEIILACGGTVKVIAERLCMSDSAASALAYIIRNGYTRTSDREVA